MSLFGTKARSLQGFSLAELLIALAIIGVIAIFTIPSLLQMPNSSQSAKYTTIARDTAYMIMGAYEQYRAANPTVAMSTTAGDLTPYMSYVTTDTSTPVDSWQTDTTWGCDPWTQCLVLHNGARLVYPLEGFDFRSGSKPSDNALLFMFDPDGKETDGTTNGPGKALAIVLYYDDSIGTEGTARPGSYYVVTYGGANYDPPWFTGF